MTFLVHDLDTMPARGLPAGYRLARLRGADLRRYRDLFRAVGADYLWFSRLRLDDAALGAILAAPAVEAFALLGPSGDIGLLELDFRDPHAAELAFFGLVAGAIGAGLGMALMAEALHRAKDRRASALHVHTCDFDHPRALDFYRRAGFRPVRRAVEIFVDPRFDGTLPRAAAPRVPLIGRD